MKTPGRIGLNDLFAGGDVLSELTRASPGSDGASPYLRRGVQLQPASPLPHANSWLNISHRILQLESPSDTDTFLKYGPNLPASVW
jgi:hypothetical protein